MPKFLDTPEWYESNGTLAQPMTTNTAQIVTSSKTFADANINFQRGTSQQLLVIGTQSTSTGNTTYYYSNTSNHNFNHCITVSGAMSPGQVPYTTYGTRDISVNSPENRLTFPDGSGTFALTSNIHKLNGSTTLGQTFYAPTSGGTSGQILVSNGSSAPTWQTFSTYVENNNISANNITITSSLGTTNLQTFLTNLMASFRTSSNRVTGASSSFQINGTCTAETFNAATVS